MERLRTERLAQDSATLVEDPWSDPAAPIRTPSGAAFRVAMVTGHRPHHLTPAELAWSQVALMHTAWRLRSVYGTVRGISGFALGADTWWAMGVLAAGMQLEAYIPFEDQPVKWPEADQRLWAELRAKAKAEVVVGGKEYDVKMLHARNQSMVDTTKAGSGLAIALYKPGTAGGTKSAVEKARQAGLPILMLDPVERRITREGW